MRKALLLTLLAAVTVFALSGCDLLDQWLTPAEYRVDESASGGQISVQVGQTLVVALPSNPSTGYSWEIVELDQLVLKPTKEDFKVESDLVGAGGTQLFFFEALKAGQTSLQLVYHRPWETGVEPADTFSISVEVR